MPSPPAPPGSPAVPPFPPGTLVYTFQTPKPDRYQINLAVGDNAVAVANQTLSVYDGTTFIATLLNGLSAPAGSYIDAQGNVLSAAQWPSFNAPVTLIFQTTQINFVIGDGVNLTYIASIQVQVVLTMEQVSRKLRRGVRRTRLARRRLFAFGYLPPMRTLVRAKPLRFRQRRPLRLIRRHLAIPVILFPSIRYMAKPKLRPMRPRRPLRCLHRKLYIPVVMKPPLVIPWRPRPVPHIRRVRRKIKLLKYPMIPTATIPSGVATPGSKVIVSVR
jgi:hypothetical protein